MYNTSHWTALYLENLDASKTGVNFFAESLRCIRELYNELKACAEVSFTLCFKVHPKLLGLLLSELQTLKHNEWKSGYLRHLCDASAHTLYSYRPGPQPCDLSPPFFHQFIYLSTSFLLFFFNFIFCDDSTTCATEVGILIPFLSRITFLFITPTLFLSSMRI